MGGVLLGDMKEFCEKWGKRIATKEMLLIVIVTLAATVVGMWAAQFPGLQILGALIIALLIGMVVQFPIRAWYTKNDPQRQARVKDAAGLIANKFLRLGIILLGFKLNLQLLFTTRARSACRSPSSSSPSPSPCCSPTASAAGWASIR